MKLTITGGSGRLGQAVIQLALAQGHEIINADQAAPASESNSATVPFIQIDTTNYDDVHKALTGADAVIHLAAIPAPFAHPDHKVHNNNVAGNYNVLSAAAQLGINRICQASSVNAIGGEFSRQPRYDYFPIDEQHSTHAEDPYGLSKWIAETQADAFARRFETMQIASLRMHWLVPSREWGAEKIRNRTTAMVKHLWGYARLSAAAQACLLSVTQAFEGHEVFNIIASDTTSETPSAELHRQHYPTVPLRHELVGNESFYDSTKAVRLLGWDPNV